jgi:hypothetical protein
VLPAERSQARCWSLEHRAVARYRQALRVAPPDASKLLPAASST